MFLKDTRYLSAQTHDATRSHGTLRTYHYFYDFTRQDLSARDKSAPKLVFGITDQRGWESSEPTDIANKLSTATYDMKKYAPLLGSDPSTTEPAPHDVILLITRPISPDSPSYGTTMTKYADVLAQVGNDRRVIIVLTHADTLSSDEIAARATAMARFLHVNKDSVLAVRNVTCVDDAVTAEWEMGMWKLVNVLVKQKEAGLEARLAIEEVGWWVEKVEVVKEGLKGFGTVVETVANAHVKVGQCIFAVVVVLLAWVVKVVFVGF